MSSNIEVLHHDLIVSVCTWGSLLSVRPHSKKIFICIRKKAIFI